MIGLVSQSNFVPWRGYFAAVRTADVLVFYDSQQFTRRDWRNRNLILTSHQPIWLTLPVKTEGQFHSAINEIQLSKANAIEKVLDKLRGVYGSSTHLEGYKFVSSILEECFQFTLLSEVNWHTTRAIAEYLGISCNFVSDLGIKLEGGKNEKLIKACNHFGINQYLSGPAAMEYLEVPKFEKNEISVEIIDFSALPRIEATIEPSILHWLITETKERCVELTTFEK